MRSAPVEPRIPIEAILVDVSLQALNESPLAAAIQAQAETHTPSRAILANKGDVRELARRAGIAFSHDLDGAA